MSEARKCDRCHEFYELPKKQQDKDAPYDIKGAYVKLLFCDNNRDYPDSVRWYDLCSNCVEILDKWLKNSDNYDPHDLVKNITEEIVNEDNWTDEDCACIGCWECKYFRQDKNIHNPYDEKDAYYCSHKKLYISGNVSRPDYMDMRYTDFNFLGCKEEKVNDKDRRNS